MVVRFESIMLSTAGELEVEAAIIAAGEASTLTTTMPATKTQAMEEEEVTTATMPPMLLEVGQVAPTSVLQDTHQHNNNSSI